MRTINNPYSGVEWSACSLYKANLHTHSTVSDGSIDLPDVVEHYYALGYDILCMTEHGVVSKGWTAPTEPIPPFNLFQKSTPLSAERARGIAAGEDRGGRGMLDVPLGIEHNMAVLRKNHVNGYFCDAGRGVWGRENDFISAPELVEKSGGLSVLNHPGDWTGANRDESVARDPATVDPFAAILLAFPTCLGVEVFNSRDTVTRNDRLFWDSLLERVVPHGRNVWGFSNDDSHTNTDVGNSFELFVMPRNDLKRVKEAMLGGHFFACGRYARRELGDNFYGSGEMPAIRDIVVDGGRIKLDADAPDEDIRWISCGEEIARGGVFDLDSHPEARIYVRFEISSPGGLLCSQAFPLSDAAEYARPVEPVPTLVTPKDRLEWRRTHSLTRELGRFAAKEIRKKLKRG